jgi:hypothetical protein
MLGRSQDIAAFGEQNATDRMDDAGLVRTADLENEADLVQVETWRNWLGEAITSAPSIAHR